MLVKLGFGLAMPRAFMDGVPMNQTEYNQYIRFINVDNDGNGESDLLQNLNALVLSAEFIDLAITDADEAMAQIQSEVKRLNNCKDLFLQTNPKFNARVNEVNKIKKERVKKGYNNGNI